MSSDDVFDSEGFEGGSKKKSKKTQKIPTAYFPSDPGIWQSNYDLYDAASEAEEERSKNEEQESESEVHRSLFGNSESSEGRKRKSSSSEMSNHRYEEEEEEEEEEEVWGESELSTGVPMDSPRLDAGDSDNELLEAEPVRSSENSDDEDDEKYKDVHEWNCPMCRYLDSRGISHGHIETMRNIWKVGTARSNIGENSIAVQLYTYYRDIVRPQIVKERTRTGNKKKVIKWSLKSAIYHVSEVCYHPSYFVRKKMRMVSEYQRMLAPHVRPDIRTPFGVTKGINPAVSREAREWLKVEIGLAQMNENNMFGGREDTSMQSAQFTEPVRKGAIDRTKNQAWIQN